MAPIAWLSLFIQQLYAIDDGSRCITHTSSVKLPLFCVCPVCYLIHPSIQHGRYVVGTRSHHFTIYTYSISVYGWYGVWLVVSVNCDVTFIWVKVTGKQIRRATATRSNCNQQFWINRAI